MTVLAGPDQRLRIRAVLESAVVGIALSGSADGQLSEIEIKLAACSAGVVLDGQVHSELIAGLDIVGVRIAGGVGCTGRLKVIKNRTGRSSFAGGTGTAAAHNELDAVELIRDVLCLGHAALRTHADALGVVFVQINRIGCVGHIRRNRDSEAVNDCAVCSFLFMSVRAGPNQSVIVRAPLEAALVGIAL